MKKELLTACEKGDTQKVKELLDRGADIVVASAATEERCCTQRYFA